MLCIVHGLHSSLQSLWRRRAFRPPLHQGPRSVRLELITPWISSTHAPGHTATPTSSPPKCLRLRRRRRSRRCRAREARVAVAGFPARGWRAAACALRRIPGSSSCWSTCFDFSRVSRSN